jgi:hypothetical protein
MMWIGILFWTIVAAAVIYLAIEHICFRRFLSKRGMRIRQSITARVDPAEVYCVIGTYRIEYQGRECTASFFHRCWRLADISVWIQDDDTDPGHRGQAQAMTYEQTYKRYVDALAEEASKKMLRPLSEEEYEHLLNSGSMMFLEAVGRKLDTISEPEAIASFIRSLPDRGNPMNPLPKEKD